MRIGVLVCVSAMLGLWGCESPSSTTATATDTVADTGTSNGDATGGADSGGGSDAGGPDAGGSDAGGSDAGGSDAGGSDAGGSDAGGSDAGGSDAGGSDAGGSDAGGSDAGGSDAGGSDAGGSDAVADAGPDVFEEPQAVLFAEDQSLETPYDAVIISIASLPSDATSSGFVGVRSSDGVLALELLGNISIAPGEVLENVTVPLNDPLVGTQTLVAEIVDGTGTVYLDASGEPVQQFFEVTGDVEEVGLAIDSQQIDPANFYGITVGYVHVPERFTNGLWLAIYEDDNGVPGTLRGKQWFAVGTSEDTPMNMTSQLEDKQTLHALLREGTLSGGWSSSGTVATALDGTVVTTQFEVDSEAFHPFLEVEDQQLETENVIKQDVAIKKVTVPQNEFFLCIVLYTDVAGQPGEVLGYKQYSTGTTENTFIEISQNQEGEKTLHALAFKGQVCSNTDNEPMLGVDGQQVKVTFKVGAPDLSYILAPPMTTTNPRFVTVERAYSFHKYAWIVLARDDGGQPGMIIAQKRVMPKFAGNVHFTQHSGGSGTQCGAFPCFGQFLKAGSPSEYLTTNYLDTVTDPSFYRRAVRGDETLHVLMYEDDPPDNTFTWTPGGTEDVPVLDASGVQVQALLDVTVQSAIDNSQKDSPRYYWPCPLSNHYTNPTTLPVDCRCHVNLSGLDFPECKITITRYLNMQFGEGPRAEGQNFGRYRSGFSDTETGELIGLIVWKDHETIWPENQKTIDVGAVIAIDLETRDRRIISGRYKDPATGIYDVGEGPVLGYPFEVQKGPDGFYYVASYNVVRIGASLVPTVDIIKVDPITGERTMHWRSNHLGYNFDNEPNPYGHCGTGFSEKYGYRSVQIGRKAFGIDADGNFYLSSYHNGYTDTSYGIGILKIGADGSTCDFVTRTKTGANNVLYTGVDIGQGVEPQAGPYMGMLLKDGKIYTSTQLDGDLYEIDIATGDRTALYTEDDGTISGSSGTHVLWDASREIIWQMGFSNAVRLYDPSTSAASEINCPNFDQDYKGINCFQIAAWGQNGLLLERGAWLHPSNSNFLFVVNGPSIMRFDMKSGNSEIFSF